MWANRILEVLICDSLLTQEIKSSDAESSNSSGQFAELRRLSKLRGEGEINSVEYTGQRNRRLATLIQNIGLHNFVDPPAERGSHTASTEAELEKSSPVPVKDAPSRNYTGEDVALVTESQRFFKDLLSQNSNQPNEKSKVLECLDNQDYILPKEAMGFESHPGVNQELRTMSASRTTMSRIFSMAKVVIIFICMLPVLE